MTPFRWVPSWVMCKRAKSLPETNPGGGTFRPGPSSAVSNHRIVPRGSASPGAKNGCTWAPSMSRPLANTADTPNMRVPFRETPERFDIASLAPVRSIPSSRQPRRSRPDRSASLRSRPVRSRPRKSTLRLTSVAKEAGLSRTASRRRFRIWSRLRGSRLSFDGWDSWPAGRSDPPRTGESPAKTMNRAAMGRIDVVLRRVKEPLSVPGRWKPRWRGGAASLGKVPSAWMRPVRCRAG